MIKNYLVEKVEIYIDLVREKTHQEKRVLNKEKLVQLLGTYRVHTKRQIN